METSGKALDRDPVSRLRSAQTWGTKRVKMVSPAAFWRRIFPLTIQLILILGVSAWFAYPAFQAYPMGDSYIHFQYARNLVNYGELTYNPGIEEGIGSTSVLWIFILATFIKMGVSPVIAAKYIGIGLLAMCGALIYDFIKFLVPNRRPRQGILVALSTSILCCLSGNLLWIALSGMETILFTALALLSLSLYSRQKWLLTGLVLGLLLLARIDGLALVLAIILVELLRHKRLESGLLKLLVPFLVLTIPWIAYLCIREGIPLPGTFQGKQISFNQSVGMIYDRNPEMEWLFKVSPLVFLISWVGYGLLYLAGSVAIPGPQISLPGVWEGAGISVPVIGLGLFALVLVPAASIMVRYLWQQCRRFSPNDHRQRMLLVFLAWVFSHNLAYAIFMPQPGSAGRYGPMNHILFWTSLVLLVVLVRAKFLKVLAGAAVAFLFLNSFYYWHQVYKVNIQYLQKVRLPAAHYMDSNCPPNTLVGTTDLGPLRYYARQPVLDLIGYVNKDVVPVWNNSGSIEDYIIEQGVECLCLFMPVNGVGADTIQIMGIAPDTRFDLISEQVFAISTNEWVLGSSAISNYMPAISIFRIIYLE